MGTHNLRRRLTGAAAMLALTYLAGCSDRQTPPVPGSRPAAETAEKLPALPEWAPEDPSREFVRAARVLKPIPEDVASYSPLWPAAYEFFGTLTDKQVMKFLRPRQMRHALEEMSEEVRALFKERYGAEEVGGKLVYEHRHVSVPFGSLTARQREVFDKLVEGWRETDWGDPDEADLIVRLYKRGAKEDLSNVEVAFSATGHVVNIDFVVRLPEGRVGSINTQIAQL